MLVPPDDPVKLVRLTRAQHRRPAPAAVGDVLRRVGARDRPRQRRHCRSSASATRRPGPSWPATPGRATSPASSPSRRRRRGRAPSPPTAPSSWAATARRPHPAALRPRRPVRPRRAGARPVRRAHDADRRWPPARRRRSSSSWARRRRRNESRRLVATLHRPRPGRGRRWPRSRRLWDRVLGAVQVQTPDPALDLMLNRWLLYQVLACRVWGRSAFYQSGGAYGFRDQLQDVMALVYGAPEEARAQILRVGRAAVRGRRRAALVAPAGRRAASARASPTTCSSCRCVVHHYVTATGDAALLDERVPFLKAPVLRPDQEEDYDLPAVSERDGHALRALRARPGARLPARAARPAADGHRRLERRHEPGRRRRQGRERLERLVPASPC